jgi:precorrin-6A/cobalt-precorrin-6A reductase
LRLLILGGTTEATALAHAIAADRSLDPVLSLAGRTANPSPPPIRWRSGGFGGAPGLTAYLRDQTIDAVVDATHPFAEQMSRNAAEACTTAAVPLVAFTRHPWQPVAGDDWIEVSEPAEAAAALGAMSRTVFLTVGRLSLPAFAAAPHHLYLVRSIDPPAGLSHLPRHRLLLARGPFDEAAEERLMREHAIDVLVTKNSGGSATKPKIDTARRLGLPVILIRRPPALSVPELHDLDAVLEWIASHRRSPALRGV